MEEGKKDRIIVRTTHAVYTGDLFIPERRKRFSDVIDAPDAMFINLTDVDVEEGEEEIKHLSINKRFIESVREVERRDL